MVTLTTRRTTMTTIRQADLIESVASALQYISYYHPVDYITHLARAYEREQSAPAKDAIYSRFAVRMKAAASQHKEDTRADWRQFFKERDRATRERAKMEKTALGLLSLSLIA